MEDVRQDAARRLMLGFAVSSGLDDNRPPRRYLWTDAHAVCNFIALADVTGDDTFRRLAVTLVDQVHNVLGRHREDDVRSGWISGLGEDEGRRHPTRGGLRIGKPLPERGRNEPHDPRAEWDQDGQYYHYLTKWMHALRQMACWTGDHRYLEWARELALAAYDGFCATSGPLRLHWKMSIDLSYPLVPSSGLHDPLDGLVTALTLRADDPEDPGLDELIGGLTALCRGRSWETDDPLGIGGLLFDAARLAQLRDRQRSDAMLELEGSLLHSADTGLAAFTSSASLRQPAAYRLAFRELGLSIGLQAVALSDRSNPPTSIRPLVERLQTYRKLGISIERFWFDPANQATDTWRDHQDINDVMLATSLVPAGMLALGAAPPVHR